MIFFSAKKKGDEDEWSKLGTIGHLRCEYPNKPNCMNNRKTVKITGTSVLQLFFLTILSIAVQIFRLLAFPFLYWLSW